MITLAQKLLSPELQGKFLIPKILSFVFSFASLVFIFYTRRQTEWTRISPKQKWAEFSSFKPYEAIALVKKWEKVKKRLEKNWESESKLAIIEADQILDLVLKRMGLDGESLGDRLKQVDQAVLPSIQDVWDAHKTRNNIIHDPDYQLSLRKAHLLIDVYEKAFTDLGAL